MHFHLPKPLHGWREFAGEVGIIVIGVLIALGAEQAVEEWHWKHETVHTRQALENEAADNLAGALQRREQQPCVDRRLKDLATIFANHAAGKPIHIYRPISRPIAYFGSTDAWQVEIASQALSHMPLEEKLSFSTAFSDYDSFNQVQRQEQNAWLHLNVLNAPDQLDQGDWPPLRQAYAEAETLNARLQIITAEVLEVWTLRQKPRSLEQRPLSVTAAIKDFCEPLLSKE